MIKAAILEKPLSLLVIRELPEPELEPGAALLETVYTTTDFPGRSLFPASTVYTK